MCSFPLVDVCMYTASVVHIPCYCLYRIAFIFIPTAIYYHRFGSKRPVLAKLDALS